MSSAPSKIDYCYIRFWLTILLLTAIIPGIALAQESFDATKNSTTVILSSPDTIKEFLAKYFKFPAEPIADSTAEKTFLFRAQKEIRSLLATEGYFSPVISLSHQTQGEVTKPEIRVDPGVLPRIGEVSIVFRGEIIQEDAKYQKRIEQLRATWPLKTDSPFRSSEWEQAKATLLSDITQEDFAAANIVTSQATIDPEHARADLSILIDSGPVFYLGAIQITGLERYDQTLITNLAPFKIGDAYRRDLLHLFQIALQKAPQFSTVSVNISPDTSQHKSIPVQVVLTEAQSQRFAFGGGYSSNNGARGEINYSLITSLQMTDIQNLKTNEQKIGITRNYQTPEIQMQFGMNWQRENKQPSGAIDQINEALTLDWRWRRQIVDDPLNIRRGNVTEIRIGGGSQQLLSTQDFVRTYARHQIWWPVGSQDC